MWAYLQIIWVKAAFYLEPMWAESRNVCGSEGLRLGAATDIQAVEDHHLEKILQLLDDHWDQALRYLRKKGMGKHRRGSNSESGMRLLRRLEKNHDGIRSATTRQHYIQIYQAIKYLSLDIAAFIEKGPQMTDPPRV
jgi:hypothetical protein